MAIFKELREKEARRMADQTTEKILVNASPAEIYEVAADIERYPEWVSDIKQVTVDERDGLGRALRVTFRAAAFGRSTTYTLLYDYTHAPEELEWKLTEGDLTSVLDGKYTFSGVKGGTEVTYHLEVALRVPIPGFVKSRAQGRIQTTALRELKARAESLR
jgi:ribosome-associated toxin RatA of RatAB toxin-antitoxin module